MNEKEKMIQGEIYNPCDKTLTLDRIRAKTLCMKYNSLLPNKTKEKKQNIERTYRYNKLYN